MLEYIYTRKMPSIKHAAQLFPCSIKNKLELLQQFCEELLCFNLSVETVCTTFLMAEKYNASNLTSDCIRFITDNATKVMLTEDWQGIVLEHPKLLAKLYQELAKRNQMLLEERDKK